MLDMLPCIRALIAASCLAVCALSSSSSLLLPASTLRVGERGPDRRGEWVLLRGDLEALGRLVGERLGERLGDERRGERRGERVLRAGLGDFLLTGRSLSTLRGDLDRLGGTTRLTGDLRGERARGERLRGERDLRLGRGDLLRLLAGEVRLAGDLRLGLGLLAGDLARDEGSGLLSRDTDITGLSPEVATTRLSLSAPVSELLAFSLSLLSLASLPDSLPELLSLLSLVSLGLLALALLPGASIGFLFLSSLGLLFFSASFGDVCLGLIPLGLLLVAFFSAGG